MKIKKSIVLSASIMLLNLFSNTSGAAIQYDLGFYDFGNDPGNTDLSTFSTTNMTSTLTADGVQWKRSGTSNTSVAFTPTTAFNLNGSCTIDIAIRRLATDSNGGTSWDNVIELCGSNGSKYRLILLGNNDTSPLFSSDPNNNEFQIYRFVITGTSNAAVYASADTTAQTTSNLWNGGSVAKIVFSVQSSRTATQGFEIAWIGISSTATNEAPGAYTAAIPEAASLGVLGLGSLLMLRKP